MKFNLILILIFIISCAPGLKTLNHNKSYNSTGFAYVYNDSDFNDKIIKGRMNNEKIQISHQNLRVGTLLKIINPKNKKSIVIKNTKRIRYPDFYKILITEKVMNELNLEAEFPILEIIELKKNKSFIAERAKVYNEEKKIPSNAPVTSVKISNISKNKIKKNKNSKDNIYIHIASFYSHDTAKFLKKRIVEELSEFDRQKLKIRQINNKETQVISGPYTSINLLKNDYIKLKNFGFEELEILINE